MRAQSNQRSQHQSAKRICDDPQQRQNILLLLWSLKCETQGSKSGHRPIRAACRVKYFSGAVVVGTLPRAMSSSFKSSIVDEPTNRVSQPSLISARTQRDRLFRLSIVIGIAACFCARASLYIKNTVINRCFLTIKLCAQPDLGEWSRTAAMLNVFLTARL